MICQVNGTAADKGDMLLKTSNITVCNHTEKLKLEKKGEVRERSAKYIHEKQIKPFKNNHSTKSN